MKRGRVHTGILCIGVAVVLSAAAAVHGQILSATEFSGRAIGISSVITTNGTGSTVVTGDTCPLPPRGGSSIVTTSGPVITGILGTGTITSTTSGAGLTSQSSSNVSDFMFSGGGWTIIARSVTSRTQCNCCDIAMPGCSGEVAVSGLSVTGPSGNVAVSLTGAANQVVTLPNGAGTITFNERVATANSITVNAMRINITSGGTNYNIVVASSHSDILCQGTGGTTPAEVSVSGRILTSDGQGIARATVTLTDSSGTARSTTTTTGGDYNFTGVTAGQTYILGASAKSYSFQSRVINVLDVMTGVDLRASP